MTLADIARELDAAARRHQFSGAVSLTRAEEVLFEGAYGMAERSNAVPNRPDTRFGTASGTKSFTALAVARLVERGALSWTTRLLDVAGEPLPGVFPDVTIAHLLTHTSGVADHFDESEVEDFGDYFVDIPWYRLRRPRDYLPLLAERPAQFAPGERFAYNNGGYVLLGLAIESVSGVPYQAFVENEVFAPCGMTDAGFFELNALPERTAVGYIERAAGWITNVYNLPIIGAPDGGAFCTVGDMTRFWRALLGGTLLSEPVLAEVLHPHQRDIEGQAGLHYGLGVYVSEMPGWPTAYFLHGEDAGVYFRSLCWPDREVVFTVASNTVNGAEPFKNAVLDTAVRA